MGEPRAFRNHQFQYEDTLKQLDALNLNAHFNRGVEDEIKGPPQACLFVANLSPATTELSIQNFFSQYGEALKVKLLKDRATKPYAFVQFKNVEDAELALKEAANISIDGRKVQIERAKVNRTLFIARIDKNMTGAQLREILEEYGDIEVVTIIKNHQTNRSKGCGFVKFLYREDAASAFKALRNNARKWIVEWAQSNYDPDELGLDKQNIFIGGLNVSVTKEVVQEKFSKYGKIETITLINKPTSFPPIQETQQGSNQKSAFAFIRYGDSASSARAMEEENGAEWMERRIRVQYCETAEMKQKRMMYKMYTDPNYGSMMFPMQVPQNSLPPMPPNAMAPFFFPPFPGYPMMPPVQEGDMPYPFPAPYGGMWYNGVWYPNFLPELEETRYITGDVVEILDEEAPQPDPNSAGNHPSNTVD